MIEILTIAAVEFSKKENKIFSKNHTYSLTIFLLGISILPKQFSDKQRWNCKTLFPRLLLKIFSYLKKNICNTKITANYPSYTLLYGATISVETDLSKCLAILPKKQETYRRITSILLGDFTQKNTTKMYIVGYNLVSLCSQWNEKWDWRSTFSLK